MNVITPVPVVSGLLATSSIPTNTYGGVTYSGWSSATTYAAGDRVVSTSTRRCYESLIAGNLNKPTTDATAWVDIGPTDRWAMFDMLNYTASTNATPITFTLAMGVVVDSIAFMELVATSVRVRITDGSTVLYDKTTSLSRTSSLSGAAITRRCLVLTDLVTTATASIAVTITNAAGTTASVCTVVVGNNQLLGDTEYGVGITSKNYSVFTEDAFGGITVTPRKKAKRITLPISLPTGAIDEVGSFLDSIADTPAVYVGSPSYDRAIALGYFEDWNIDLQYPNYSDMSMTIKGVT